MGKMTRRTMTRKERRVLDAKLRNMPMEETLVLMFGREAVAGGQVVYDEAQDLWIAPNPRHVGDGFGFVAVRRDKSWFCGVVPAGKFQ